MLTLYKTMSRRSVRAIRDRAAPGPAHRLLSTPSRPLGGRTADKRLPFEREWRGEGPGGDAA